jgi:nucleotide-binding universal stress UspA family protein
MNIKSILFPTDFSHYNDAALEYASSLAGEANATLHIVHVHDARELNTATGEACYVYVAAWQEQRRVAERRLNKVEPTVEGVAYEHHSLVGDPVTDILSVAAENKVDLIVMASHGRSGLSRLLMGSVAEGVMRQAPCPVLIVKRPSEAPKRETHPTNSNEEFRLVS